MSHKKRKKKEDKAEEKPAEPAAEVSIPVPFTRKTRIVLIRDHLLLFRRKYSLGFILLIAIILSIFIYFIVSSQIHFALNNEIVIRHDPRLVQMEAERNSSVVVNVSVDVDPYKRCTSVCKTTIHNLLDNESIFYRHNASGVFSTTFMTPAKGYGHFFVSAKTSCVNGKTLFCPSLERPFVESSLYGVSYSLTDVEQTIVTENTFDEMLENLSYALIVQEMTPAQFISVNLSLIASTIKNGLTSWSAQDYEEAATALSQTIPLELVEADYELYRNSVLSYNTLTERIVSIGSDFSIFDPYNKTAVLFEELRERELVHLNNAEDYITNTSLSVEYAGIVSQLTAIDSQSYTDMYQKFAFYSNLTNSTIDACDNITVFEPYNCELQNYTQLTFPEITVPSELLNVTEEIENVSESALTLEPVKPSCCQQGVCTSCEERYTPILFIHGHAFSQDNTPEHQMSAFALLQDELPYTNGGVIDIQSTYDLPYGAYARTTQPITFRGTFYYINAYEVGDYALTVQKSERIENYALRLRELVEATKYLTDSDEVIIVAHSMGGLVAREYINIFGNTSVAKLITINTPHRGITGRTESSCSWFGANKECDDMSQGSLFLKRLDPIQDLYIIHSTGCVMGDTVGDGVVTFDNGLLPNARETVLIQGNCTDVLDTSLHTDVLNSKLYPEITDLLIGFIED